MGAKVTSGSLWKMLGLAWCWKCRKFHQWAEKPCGGGAVRVGGPGPPSPHTGQWQHDTPAQPWSPSTHAPSPSAAPSRTAGPGGSTGTSRKRRCGPGHAADTSSEPAERGRLGTAPALAPAHRAHPQPHCISGPCTPASSFTEQFQEVSGCTSETWGSRLWLPPCAHSGLRGSFRGSLKRQLDPQIHILWGAGWWFIHSSVRAFAQQTRPECARVCWTVEGLLGSAESPGRRPG